MPRFQPSFSLWPWPQFLGESSSGFASWIAHRDRAPNVEAGHERRRAIKAIIEEHHDDHSRTIGRDAAITPGGRRAARSHQPS